MGKTLTKNINKKSADELNSVSWSNFYQRFLIKFNPLITVERLIDHRLARAFEHDHGNQNRLF